MPSQPLWESDQQQGAGLQQLLLQPPQLQLQPPHPPQPHPQPQLFPPQLLFPQQHQTIISRMMIQQQFPPPKPLLHMMKPPERCRPNRTGLSSSYAARPRVFLRGPGGRAPQPPGAPGGTPRGPAQPRPPNQKSAGPRSERQKERAAAAGGPTEPGSPPPPSRGGRPKGQAARGPRGGSHHFRAIQCRPVYHILCQLSVAPQLMGARGPKPP